MATPSVTETNIEVVRCSDRVRKAGGKYFIYIGAKARPTTFTGIKAYVTDPDDIKRLDSIYKKE